MRSETLRDTTLLTLRYGLTAYLLFLISTNRVVEIEKKFEVITIIFAMWETQSKDDSKNADKSA